jgi:hypothetical protein
MRPDDLVGYTYRAANYCGEHIIPALVAVGDVAAPAALGNVEQYGLEATLDELADAQAIDRENESSFDSGDFPKVLLRSSAEPYTGPAEDQSSRCDNCGVVLADAEPIPWRAAADLRGEIDAFLRGYMECAVWASNDPDTEAPLDDKYSTADIDAALQSTMRQECAAFVRAQYDDLRLAGELTGRDWASLGHDLWLTRNGHGAGYWDRYMEAPKAKREQAEQVGKRLSEAAKQIGERDLMPDGGHLVSMQ